MFRVNTMRGQTLIEVLVAFSVAIILVAAITTAVISALSNAQYSKTQNVATQYTQEGMEIVRKIRDSGGVFADSQKTYCLPKGVIPENVNELTEKPAAGCAPIDGTFVRELTTEPGGSECSGGTKITLVVSWSDSKCKDQNNLYCHKANFISCLSEFTTVSTPGTNATPVPPTPTTDPGN